MHGCIYVSYLVKKNFFNKPKSLLNKKPIKIYNLWFEMKSLLPTAVNYHYIRVIKIPLKGFLIPSTWVFFYRRRQEKNVWVLIAKKNTTPRNAHLIPVGSVNPISNRTSFMQWHFNIIANICQVPKSIKIHMHLLTWGIMNQYLVSNAEENEFLFICTVIN